MIGDHKLNKKMGFDFIKSYLIKGVEKNRI